MLLLSFRKKVLRGHVSLCRLEIDQLPVEVRHSLKIMIDGEKREAMFQCSCRNQRINIANSLMERSESTPDIGIAF